MLKIIEEFEKTRAVTNNPNCSYDVLFPIDTDNSENWRLLDYLQDNKGDIHNNNKIVFVPFGVNTDKFICGVAPMWKEYPDKSTFEMFYTQSEMMRTLFCNEKDESGNLLPIYALIGDIKYIVTWESTKKNDIFHYKQATLHERGLFDVLWSNFGGGVKDDKKILNPRFGIMFDRSINKDYGLSVGMVKAILDHCDNLDYSVCGEIKIDIG